MQNTRIEILSKQIEENSENPELYFQRGILYHQDKKWKQAIKDYNKAIIHKYPEIDQVFCNRAAAKILLDQYDEAIVDCNRAIANNKNNALAFNNLAVALRKKGNYKEGKKIASKAIKLDPLSPSAYKNKGLILFKLKDYHKASQSLQKSLEIAPNDSECLMTLGLIAKIFDDFTEAITLFQKAIESYTKEDIEISLAFLYYELGDCFKQNKDNNTAEHFYNLAIKLNPGYSYIIEDKKPKEYMNTFKLLNKI